MSAKLRDAVVALIRFIEPTISEDLISEKEGAHGAAAPHGSTQGATRPGRPLRRQSLSSRTCRNGLPSFVIVVDRRPARFVIHAGSEGHEAGADQEME
jgi:hypothetical protein